MRGLTALARLLLFALLVWPIVFELMTRGKLIAAALAGVVIGLLCFVATDAGE